VIEHYRDDPAPALREQVATALVYKGYRLGRLDRPVEAIAAYDQVIEHCRDDPAPALREQVATALRNKSAIIARQE
jgi:hypothetical protein